MDQNLEENDIKILERLRKPIDDLVNKYCINQPLINRMRLRQLPWQAIDVLVKTEDVAHLKTNSNIKRIIKDIKHTGVPEKFIDESLNLAINIYQSMKTEYPLLYKRYKG
jgi:hypothetical protein